MASLIPGYEYDIFISYRQKDNKGDRWVSKFVESLKTELEATFKEDISVYFDENPYDRLHETHNVDRSLEGGAQLFRINYRLDSLFNTMYDTIKEYYKFKCDEEGIWNECKVYNANTDTLMYSFTKNINTSRDTIEYQQFNNKGGPDLKMLFLYNDKKQFTGLESYDKDGVFQGSSKITYNDKGKILNATFFDKDKKSNYNFNRKYEYDTKGNWLKTVSRDAAGKIAIHERTYFYIE